MLSAGNSHKRVDMIYFTAGRSYDSEYFRPSLEPRRSTFNSEPVKYCQGIVHQICRKSTESADMYQFGNIRVQRIQDRTFIRSEYVFQYRSWPSSLNFPGVVAEMEYMYCGE
jgi:hypothetical protein